jgi:hypothetical protein
VAVPIHGRAGRLYVDLTGSGSAEPVANLKSWSIDFSTDRIDTTCFGDTNKKYTAGLPDASGDFGGFLDIAGPQLYTAAADGAARKFYLYPTTSSATYWFGTGLFDFHAEGAVDSSVDVSGTWAAATIVSKVQA